MALQWIPSTVVATLLLLAPVKVVAQAPQPFVCDGSTKLYNATKTYVGCYLDSTVGLLGEAKISTVAMTPQYCANWCGGQGFSYGGLRIGA